MLVVMDRRLLILKLSTLVVMIHITTFRHQERFISGFGLAESEPNVYRFTGLHVIVRRIVTSCFDIIRLPIFF